MVLKMLVYCTFWPEVAEWNRYKQFPFLLSFYVLVYICCYITYNVQEEHCGSSWCVIQILSSFLYFTVENLFFFPSYFSCPVMIILCYYTIYKVWNGVGSHTQSLAQVPCCAMPKWLAHHHVVIGVAVWNVGVLVQNMRIWNGLNEMNEWKMTLTLWKTKLS